MICVLYTLHIYLMETGMPNTTNKLHINDTVLFKQVASVLGKGKALEELLRACRGYTSTYRWSFRDSLATAFHWSRTPQGDKYWEGVMDDYYKQINNR